MKIKKIASFGDSFIFGSEIDGNTDGSLAWPGLAAKKLGLQYETLAIPGCGNESIAKQIFEYFAVNEKSDVLVIINWTWKMRWDYCVCQDTDTWSGLGPTCVPSKLKKFFNLDDCNEIIQFYSKFIDQNDYFNLLRTLLSINSTQKFLKENNILNVQTTIDNTIIDSQKKSKIDLEFYEIHKDSSWPECNLESDLEKLPTHIKEELIDLLKTNIDPPWLSELRNQIKNEIEFFEENLGFLEWSYKNNFPVTAKGLHPLNEAHKSACDLWSDYYLEKIKEYERTKI